MTPELQERFKAFLDKIDAERAQAEKNARRDVDQGMSRLIELLEKHASELHLKFPVLGLAFQRQLAYYAKAYVAHLQEQLGERFRVRAEDPKKDYFELVIEW